MQPRLPARSALVCICVFVMSLCSFYMCCCCSLSLSPHTPALCNSQFPSSGHPFSSQELEKPLSGARTSSLPPHPPPPRCLPCPSPSLLYNWLAWQPGRQGSYQRMGEVGLSGAFSSAPIPRHTKAVPELDPLSLLREASVYPQPLPSKRTTVLGPVQCTEDPVQQEPWPLATLPRADCSICAPALPHPPLPGSRGSSPAHISGHVGRDRAPCWKGTVALPVRGATEPCWPAR